MPVSSNDHGSFLDFLVEMRQKGPKLNGKTVPDSCINATEWVVRRTAYPNILWRGLDDANKKGKPSVYFRLRNGDNYAVGNLSKFEDQQLFEFAQGKSSYFTEENEAFPTDVKPGTGLGFVKIGRRKTRYDMHFVFVVARSGRGIHVGEVSEPNDWDGVSEVEPQLHEVATPAELRTVMGKPYSDPRMFVLGLVTSRR